MSEVQFNRATEIVETLPETGPFSPTVEDKLELYKYYKQAKIGNVNTLRPGLLDFQGKYKWDAWNSQKGITKEASYKNYVDKLIKLLKAAVEAGDENSKKLVEELEALAPEVPQAEVLELAS